MTRIGSFVLKNVPDNGNPIIYITEVNDGSGWRRAKFVAEKSIFERVSEPERIRRIRIKYRRAA